MVHLNFFEDYGSHLSVDCGDLLQHGSYLLVDGNYIDEAREVGMLSYQKSSVPLKVFHL